MRVLTYRCGTVPELHRVPKVRLFVAWLMVTREEQNCSLIVFLRGEDGIILRMSEQEPSSGQGDEIPAPQPPQPSDEEGTSPQGQANESQTVEGASGPAGPNDSESNGGSDEGNKDNETNNWDEFYKQTLIELTNLRFNMSIASSDDASELRQECQTLLSEFTKRSTTSLSPNLSKEQLKMRVEEINDLRDTLKLVKDELDHLESGHNPAEQKLDEYRGDRESHPQEVRALADQTLSLTQFLNDPKFDPESKPDLMANFSRAIELAKASLEDLRKSSSLKAAALTQEYIEPADAVKVRLQGRLIGLENVRQEEIKQRAESEAEHIYKSVRYDDLRKIAEAPHLPPNDEVTPTITKLKTLREQLKTEQSPSQIEANIFDAALEVYVSKVDLKIADLEIAEFGQKTEKLREAIAQINKIDPLTRTDDLSPEPLSASAIQKRMDAIRIFRAQAEKIGIFDVTNQPPHLVQEINELNNNVIKAQRLGADYLAEANRLKPAEEMSDKELADEIVHNRMDPLLWGEWKVPTGVDQRTRDVINKFIIDVVFTRKEDKPKEELERLYQKLRVQLGTMDNKLVGEDEKATVNRAELYKEMQGRVITRREEVIVASLWDGQALDIIDYILRVAVKRKNEAGYNPRLSYEVLASENGRTYLSQEVTRIFGSGGRNYAKEAQALAQVLFTSHDLLAIILRERQKMTQTGAHQIGVKDIDHNLLQEPTGPMVHRAFRYGGNDMDWSLWWLFYLENVIGDSKLWKQLGINSDDPHQWSTEPGGEWEKLWKYRRLGRSPANLKRIWEIQELIKLHQNGYFDITGITGSIPFPKELETLFPATDAYMKMFPGESIWRVNEFIDNKGHVLAKKVKIGDKFVIAVPAAVKEDPETGQEAVSRKGVIAFQDEEGNVFDANGTRLGNTSQIFFVVENQKIVGLNRGKRGEGAVIPVAGRNISNPQGRDPLNEFQFEGFVQHRDQYQQVESAWKFMLESAFKDLGGGENGLTRHDILGSVKGSAKGGMLHDYYSAVGKAKMFPGRHLEVCLVPLLTHYIIRIFQRVRAEVKPELRLKLWEDVRTSLWVSSKDSGGLEGFIPQIEEVIRIIESDEDKSGIPARLLPGSLNRRDERQRYLEEWWKEEKVRAEDIKQGKGVPKSYMELLPEGYLGVPDNKNEFFDIVSNKIDLPLPVTRDGDMYAKHEEEAKVE